MPSPDQILAGLTEIAQSSTWLAAVWHLYLAVLIVGLLYGTIRSNRIAGILLCLPLISVSSLAWNAGNPFNGALFALFAILGLVKAGRLGGNRIIWARPPILVPGAIMLAFGWVYPHFLDTRSIWPYIYSAPTGLIPCPTLSVVIGLGLMLSGMQSRWWSLVMGATGLFYGLFGALRLGVSLDWGLAAGAILMLYVSLTMKFDVSGENAGTDTIPL
jgi:hypothetical protein